MSRYRMREIDWALAELLNAAENAGLDTSGWSLREGNSSYGRPYRLLTPGSTVIHGGILGKTRSQAICALEHLTGAMRAVAAVRS